jgi:hypothetical protein
MELSPFKSITGSETFWDGSRKLNGLYYGKLLFRSPRGSSQNIVILLLVFPAVRMSLRDYLRIYSGKVFMLIFGSNCKIMELSPFKSITGSDTFWDGSTPNPLTACPFTA